MFHQNQIMNKTDNIVDRDQLQNDLIDRIVDDMDTQTLMQVVTDYLTDSYDKFSVTDLISEVEEYYPDLLENDG